jgi:hypothetical protein
MLARYSNGETVTPEDHEDLAALLIRYDAAIEDSGTTKIGVGIECFKRQSNAELGWSTDGFWVYRSDGTSIDFSYIKAVKNT